MDTSLMYDVGAEVLWAILTPVIGFFISCCIRHRKRLRLSKKYGSGEGGFIIDDKVIERMRALTGENKTLSAYSGNDPVAKAVSGSYIGKKGRKAVSFLGIPYAKAERWKRAVQLDDSTVFFEAHYFGNSEIQPDSNHNVLTEFGQDEDCLSLNIWTSEFEPGEKSPCSFIFTGGTEDTGFWRIFIV